MHSEAARLAGYLHEDGRVHAAEERPSRAWKPPIGPSVSSILGEVTAPVLVIHATEDSVNPLSQSRLLAASLPDARLEIVEGRNHVPLPGTRAWEEIARKSVEFLKSA